MNASNGRKGTHPVVPDDRQTPQPAEPRTGDVIDRLYEVAIDPGRYEALLDRWEEMIRPQRAAATSARPILSLDHLRGHVERADQVLDRVIRDVTLDGPSARLTQIDRTAAFAVDRDGRVIEANAAARHALNLSPGDRVEALPLAEGEADHLAHTIGRLLTGNGEAEQVVRGRLAPSDRLIVFHLRPVRDDAGFPPYVLALTTDMHWPAGFSEMLRGAFDLTPAEAEIVRALAEGRSLQQVATGRGRSIDTIRAQLKSVMSKTETRSQTELVRLTLSTLEIMQFSTQMASDLPAISAGFDTLEPRPFHSFTLPDGRRMDYLILGDPTGRPVLYSPLDYGLCRWPATAEAAAAAARIRVVVPIRAGYGQASPIPRAVPHVMQLADDYAALLDHLGIDDLPMITMGGDSHIGVTLATNHPQRVRALICAAGVLPLSRAEQYERMDKWHRFILAGARYTPHLLPFLVKAGFALARKLGKRGFVHAVYGKSAADVETFENPEVYEAMVCGSEIALSDTHSAHDAFAREVIAHETTDWADDVLSLKGRIPVHFLNGLQDPQVPPETLREHQEEYPWIDWSVHPDAGQLLFFLKWPQILDRVGRYL